MPGETHPLSFAVLEEVEGARGSYDIGIAERCGKYQWARAIEQIIRINVFVNNTAVGTGPPKLVLSLY
jgi:hypothetical protein